MAENNEADTHAKSEQAPERVGDIIRKERVTRRIALETIAKDLKLNVKYIKALEANEYNSLPAEPYIRVYFRSLAKYLMLDPEEILKRFYEERGVPPEVYKKEIAPKVSVAEMENKRSFKPWVIIVIVIVVLAAISFVAKKAGLITTLSTEQSSETGASGKTGADSASRGQSHADSVEDSLFGAMVGRHDSASQAATPATEAGARQQAEAEARREVSGADSGRVVLDIRAVKDSVWIQAFSDGQSSRIYLRANQTKRFTAHDSLNVHVGNNAELRYTLNGKPMYIKAKNIAVFKLSRGNPTPEMWNLTKWTSVFKDRL